MILRLLSIALVAAGCSTNMSPAGEPAPVHELPLYAPPEHLWVHTGVVYRELRLPIADETREGWSIRSTDLVNALPALTGESAGQSFRCGTSLGIDPPTGSDTHVSVSTSLRPDGGRNGVVTHQNCLTTGVLEERVFRTLQWRE